MESLQPWTILLELLFFGFGGAFHDDPLLDFATQGFWVWFD